MDTDIKVTINLNKIVEERIKKMGAYRDFAEKSIQGTLVSTSDGIFSMIADSSLIALFSPLKSVFYN